MQPTACCGCRLQPCICWQKAASTIVRRTAARNGCVLVLTVLLLGNQQPVPAVKLSISC
jgi:hypothetical protein